MTDHEIVDFRKDVLEASGTTAVLVDFWAPWCGPCRILGPILEKLEGEAGGDWKLAKVNVDQHPDLAERYDVQGIPAVKLFREGELVAEFMGALPETSIRRWLQENLPLGSASALEAARLALEEGRDAEALAHLEEALRLEPNSGRVRLQLGRLLFTQEPRRARDLLAGVEEGDPDREEAARLVWLADLGPRIEGTALGTEPAGDLDLYRHGTEALASQRFEEAIQAWLELVARNRALDEDGGRRALLAVFALLGAEHPLTRVYRPRLASLLY